MIGVFNVYTNICIHVQYINSVYVYILAVNGFIVIPIYSTETRNKILRYNRVPWDLCESNSQRIKKCFDAIFKSISVSLLTSSTDAFSVS